MISLSIEKIERRISKFKIFPNGLLAGLLILQGCSFQNIAEEVPSIQDPEKQPHFQTEATKPQEHILAPGDQLLVNVYRRSDFKESTKRVLTVDRFGKVFLPETGDVKVEGKTRRDLMEILKPVFSRELVDPIVRVTVTDRANQSVYVFGEVSKPGMIGINDQTTALEVVLQAGGPTNDADLAKIVLVRTIPVGRNVQTDAINASMDFEALLRDAEYKNNVILNPRDIIYVPPSGMALKGRYYEHVNRVVMPFANTFGVIGTLLVITGVAGGS